MSIFTLKRKLFGKSENRDFAKTAETGMRDILKILVMGYKDPQDISHWLKVSRDGIFDSNKRKPTNPKIQSFLGIGTEKEKMKIGDRDSVLRKSTDTPEQFIERIWKDTYNQTGEDSKIKYSTLMSPKPTKDEVSDLVEKLRYIALRFTGQLKEGDWNWDGKSLRMEINFKSKTIDNLTQDQVKEKLKSIILELCPGLEIPEKD